MEAVSFSVPFDTPILVGRSLADEWAQAAAGAGTLVVVLVSGWIGIGTTRFGTLAEGASGMVSTLRSMHETNE